MLNNFVKILLSTLTMSFLSTSMDNKKTKGHQGGKLTQEIQQTIVNDEITFVNNLFDITFSDFSKDGLLFPVKKKRIIDSFMEYAASKASDIIKNYSLQKTMNNKEKWALFQKYDQEQKKIMLGFFLMKIFNFDLKDRLDKSLETESSIGNIEFQIKEWITLANFQCKENPFFQYVAALNIPDRSLYTIEILIATAIGNERKKIEEKNDKAQQFNDGIPENQKERRDLEIKNTKKQYKKDKKKIEEKEYCFWRLAMQTSYNVDIIFTFMDRFLGTEFSKDNLASDIVKDFFGKESDIGNVFKFMNTIQRDICSVAPLYLPKEFSQQMHYFTDFFKEFAHREKTPKMLKEILLFNADVLNLLSAQEIFYKNYNAFNIFKREVENKYENLRKEEEKENQKSIMLRIEKHENIISPFQERVENLRLSLNDWSNQNKDKGQALSTFLSFLGFQGKKINQITREGLKDAIEKQRFIHEINDNIDDIEQIFKCFSEKKNIDISVLLNFYKKYKFDKSEKEEEKKELKNDYEKKRNKYFVAIYQQKILYNKVLDRCKEWLNKLESRILQCEKDVNFKKWSSRQKNFFPKDEVLNFTKILFVDQTIIPMSEKSSNISKGEEFKKSFALQDRLFDLLSFIDVNVNIGKKSLLCNSFLNENTKNPIDFHFSPDCFLGFFMNFLESTKKFHQFNIFFDKHATNNIERLPIYEKVISEHLNCELNNNESVIKKESIQNGNTINSGLNENENRNQTELHEKKQREFIEKIRNIIAKELKQLDGQNYSLADSAEKEFESIRNSQKKIEDKIEALLKSKKIISFYFSLNSDGFSLEKLLKRMKKSFFKRYKKHEDFSNNLGSEETKKSFEMLKKFYEKIIGLEKTLDIEYFEPNQFVSLMNMFVQTLQEHEDLILLKEKDNNEIKQLMLFSVALGTFKKNSGSYVEKFKKARKKFKMPEALNNPHDPEFYLSMEQFITKKTKEYKQNATETMQKCIKETLKFFNKEKDLDGRTLKKIIGIFEPAAKEYPYCSVFIDTLARAYEKKGKRRDRVLELYERASLLENPFSKLKLASLHQKRSCGFKAQEDPLNLYKSAFVDGNVDLNLFLIKMNQSEGLVNNTFDIDFEVFIKMDRQKIDKDSFVLYIVKSINSGENNIDNPFVEKVKKGFDKILGKNSDEWEVVETLCKGKIYEKEIIDLLKKKGPHRQKKLEVFSLYENAIEKHKDNSTFKKCFKKSFKDLKKNLSPYLFPKKIESEYKYLMKKVKKVQEHTDTIKNGLSLSERLKGTLFQVFDGKMKLLLETSGVIDKFIKGEKSISHEVVQEEIKKIENEVSTIQSIFKQLMASSEIADRLLMLKNQDKKTIKSIYLDLENGDFKTFKEWDSFLSTQSVNNEVCIKWYKCKKIIEVLNEKKKNPTIDMITVSNFDTLLDSFKNAYKEFLEILKRNNFELPSPQTETVQTEVKKPVKKEAVKEVKKETSKKNIPPVKKETTKKEAVKKDTPPVKKETSKAVKKDTPEQNKKDKKNSITPSHPSPESVTIQNSPNQQLVELSNDSGLCSTKLVNRIEKYEKKKKGLVFLKKEEFIETLKICEKLSDMLSTMGKTYNSGIAFHVLKNTPAKIKGEIRDAKDNEVMCSLSIAGDTKYRLVLIFNTNENVFNLNIKNSSWFGNYHYK